MALGSAALLSLIVLAVLFGPLVWRVPINDIDFTATLATPTWQHPFGTDDLGQDLLARMLYGGRISIAVGLAAMMVSVVVGTIVGSLAGISRGSVDTALMWLTDLFLSLPQLPLLLLIIYLFRDALKAVAGPEFGVFVLIVAVIGAFRWMPVARLVRAQFFSLREKEFVEAAISQGASPLRVMFSELLPNITSSVLVFFTLIIANNIVLEAALSFLGAGVQDPTPSWGKLIALGQQLIVTRPLLALAPGIAIILTVLSLNIFGDGLRDALDPRAKVRVEH
jgi:peptide/nickel transport system permease protein